GADAGEYWLVCNIKEVIDLEERVRVRPSHESTTHHADFEFLLGKQEACLSPNFARLARRSSLRGACKAKLVLLSGGAFEKQLAVGLPAARMFPGVVPESPIEH